MRLDIDAGLIEDARFLSSPNCDDRPNGATPELIVVHAISLPPGEFGGHWIDDLFCNCLDPDAHPYFRDIFDQHVSAHMLIRRNGGLTQYVPFHRRAWHAGESSYCQRHGCNDFSVGIELEGCDEQPFEPVQYERLAEVIAALETAYAGIDRSRVVGHSDIAPGRKTDPGPCFDWKRLNELLA
ncbi:MAG: 1,6-anhydro-N-acetylmuramyl-L-alanine amidase AmpD [Gammaproteobacteria bacterium]|nr:MAG: 1,6-anhydro-N-acetylmuramyl-L-alanine amidase AmpD [Gammaproteobacteria bacterium]